MPTDPDLGFDLGRWMQGAVERNEILEKLSPRGCEKHSEICRRHAVKIFEWAESEPPHVRTVAIVDLWIAYQEEKRDARLLRRAFKVMGGMPDLEEELAGRLGKHTAARRKGARAKLDNDPKQKAKAGALVLWNEWRAGGHPKLRRVQDFATEVMRRWPVLTNAKTIEGWSAMWTKAARGGNGPAS